MRRFEVYIFLSIGLSAGISPFALSAQDWTLEADIELASKYEWRGLQLDPGLNAQYAACGSLAWDDLMLTTGLPARSGVGGGIVAVVPGKGAIAAFSPRLDGAGNSVRAQRAIAYISEELGINIFSPQSVGVGSQR